MESFGIFIKHLLLISVPAPKYKKFLNISVTFHVLYCLPSFQIVFISSCLYRNKFLRCIFNNFCSFFAFLLNLFFNFGRFRFTPFFSSFFLSSSSLILFQTAAANFIFAVDSTPALESLNFFFVELFTVVFSDVSVADVGGIDIYVFVCTSFSSKSFLCA